MRHVVCMILAVCLVGSTAAWAAVDPPATETKPAEDPKPAVKAKAVEETKPAPTAKEPTPSSGDDFVAMDPADSEYKEDLPGWPFLYSAYAIIWIGLFWYLLSLGRRQRRVDAQIAELRAIVQEKVGKA